MVAQEYKIKALKKGKIWQGAYGEFQDYALSLEGVGEPVRLSTPTPTFEDPEPGDVLYGVLTEEKANDRIYYKLELKKHSADYERTLDIHAQVGLKIAVEVWQCQGSDLAAYDNIATEAIHFARLINVIKKEL